jgi:putative acetyltransferase
LKIRTVDLEDSSDLYRLHLDAFAEEEREAVAQLAIALLTDETAKPLLALAVEDQGRAVGCVIFSRVEIHGSESTRAAILAPLAVDSSHQRQGLGSELVRHGLGTLLEEGMDLVLVYGNPNYYSRFGFTSNHHVSAPFPLEYPEAWMACELTKGVISHSSGTAVCAKSISHPEYW